MGYEKCAIRCCPSSSIRNKDLKFHHFPTDVDSRKIWINACKRQDIIGRDAEFFKDKYVCGLHFDKSMYKQKNLLKSAFPSLYLPDLPVQYNSYTQTWESIKFFRPNLEIKETDADGVYVMPDVKKIEVRTSHTQTEECMPYNEPEEIEDHETSHTLNEETTEEEIKEETEKYELVSQITIEEHKLFDTPETETGEGTDAQTFQSVQESIKSVNTETENKKEDDTKTSSHIVGTYGKKLEEKSIQTDNVMIYLVPNNVDHYFQQCVQCGNRQKVARNGEPVVTDDLIKEEFLSACDKFLSPAFSTCVKNQIILEELMKESNNIGNTENTYIPVPVKRRRIMGKSVEKCACIEKTKQDEL